MPRFLSPDFELPTGGLQGIQRVVSGTFARSQERRSLADPYDNDWSGLRLDSIAIHEVLQELPVGRQHAGQYHRVDPILVNHAFAARDPAVIALGGEPEAEDGPVQPHPVVPVEARSQQRVRAEFLLDARTLGL